MMFLMHYFPTWMCYHVAFELISRNELLITRVALKYFMYLQQKSKREYIQMLALLIIWKTQGKGSVQVQRSPSALVNRK